MRTKILALLILMSPLAVLAADKITPLDVKTGLWETTMTITTAGQMPLPSGLLAKLPPERRARLEERMKANAGHGDRTKTSTYKRCLTKEDLTKDPFSDPTKGCTAKVVTSTRSKAEVHVSCVHEDVKTTGSVLFEALNSENVKGSGHMVSSGGAMGTTLTSETSITSKWIGSSCGSTK
jgi:hypothetical protein